MYWKIFLVLLVCFIIFISLLPVKEENYGQNIKIESTTIDMCESEKEIVFQGFRKYEGKEVLIWIKIEEAKEKQGIKIKSHGYTFISKVDDIKELKNMNTYVFFPDNISSQNNHKSKKYKRYEKVLELIQETPKYDINITSLGKKAKEINRFILMNKKLNEKKITVESYNYDLANRILRIIRKRNYTNEIDDIFFRLEFMFSDGPYLITTTENILNISDPKKYLLLDLSTFNDSAIKEIIRTYKQHLIDDGNVDFTSLEKFRYKVLFLITDINSNIKTMHKAVAGEL